MNKDQILVQVNDIFRELLDNDSIVIQGITTANDVVEWDSLTHIQLVVGIEKHFKIRFTSIEIQTWNNVGEMIDCIKNKIN